MIKRGLYMINMVKLGSRVLLVELQVLIRYC